VRVNPDTELSLDEELGPGRDEGGAEADGAGADGPFGGGFDWEFLICETDGYKALYANRYTYTPRDGQKGRDGAYNVSQPGGGTSLLVAVAVAVPRNEFEP
jgi:hypothetical protein